MKTFMITTALVAATTLSAAAQDIFVTEPDPAMIRASEFIGMRVYASETTVDATDHAGMQDGWQDIGEISDVILTRTGGASAVLVDVGGFLGIGERQVALSMPELHFVNDTSTAHDLDDFLLVVNASRAVIEGARAWNMSDAVPPVGPAPVIGETVPEGVMVAPHGTLSDTASPGPAMMVEGFDVVELDGLTAEQLIGAPVFGPENARIAEVSGVHLGENGIVSEVIIDVGGFLGIGQRSVAVLVDEAQILKDDDDEEIRIYLPMSKDTLTAMPEAVSN